VSIYKKCATILFIIGIIVTFYSSIIIKNSTKTVIDVDSDTGGYSITYNQVTLNDILLENCGVALISISLTLFITRLDQINNNRQ